MELYTIGNKVTGAFLALIEVVGDQDEDSTEYRQFVVAEQRFRLWSHSLGLLHHGHASLDYRVRDAIIVRDRLAEILLGLAEHLLELKSIYREERQPFEDEVIESTAASIDESSESDGSLVGYDSDKTESSNSEMIPIREVDFRLQSVTESINALYSLATKIRHPRNRPQRTIAQLFKNIPPDNLVQYIHNRESVEASIIAYVQRQQLLRTMDANQGLELELLAEYTSPKHWIIRRTAVANVRRKQQFIYWREHALKLGHGMSPFGPRTARPHGIPEEEESERLRGVSSKALTFVRARKDLLISEKSSPTSATRLDPDFMGRDLPSSDISQPSRVSTAMNLAGDTVTWPPSPDVNPSELFFTCPYCNTICPRAYLLEASWHAHLINDLQPFHCTFQNCQDPNRLYGSKQEWIDHEIQHTQVWHCRKHDEEYETQLEYVKHLQVYHTDTLEERSPELIASALSPSEKVHRTCPYCPINPSEVGDMQKHILFHLQHLAILALPNFDDRSIHSDYSHERGRSVDSQFVQRRGRQNSITEDFNDLEFAVFSSVFHDDRGTDTVKSISMLTDEILQKAACPPESTSTSTWVEDLPSDFVEPDYVHRVHDLETHVPDTNLLVATYEAPDTVKEVSQLRNKVSAQRSTPIFHVLYRITCYRSGAELKVSRDPPSLVNDGPHDAHARSDYNILNMKQFLDENKDTSFLVYRDYACCGNDPPLENLLHQDPLDELSIEALFTGECIDIISPGLRRALAVMGSHFHDVSFPNVSQKDSVIHHPYIWWYHRRSQIVDRISTMKAASQSHLEALASYLQESLGKEWEVVDELLAGHRISTEFLHYLFVPNEVIFLSRTKGSDVASLEGYLLRDWAKIARRQTGTVTVKFDTSHWDFDGNFVRNEGSLYLERIPSMYDDYAITDLSIYPQRFASPETVKAMRERGGTFWKCRYRLYVECVGQTDNRYREMSRLMVDVSTYNEMHPREPPRASQDHHQLDDELMAEEYPDLHDDFFMCLPTKIVAFSMQRKEWISVKVADIRPVTWNMGAFELLVLEPVTKELIEAVITHRLLAGEDTDVTEGTSKGLIMLLHGRPGTGKTFTAECVAEVAMKPLYRITCGDIGTKPDEVELYLESVLLLAKTWDCVLLLDDADVFLEQRRLDNLDRNALVSVFFRILEYFDGILIMTSNHVDTFDEAFKSRIQLSLRYDYLSRYQRRKIWENSIDRLEVAALSNDRDIYTGVNAPSTRRRVDVGIDAAGIRAHLDDLAQHALNGREIRNAISTARQLAMFRRVPVSYEHLETVIIEAKKFQDYINDIKRAAELS